MSGAVVPSAATALIAVKLTDKSLPPWPSYDLRPLSDLQNRTYPPPWLVMVVAV